MTLNDLLNEFPTYVPRCIAAEDIPGYGLKGQQLGRVFGNMIVKGFHKQPGAHLLIVYVTVPEV